MHTMVHGYLETGLTKTPNPVRQLEGKIPADDFQYWAVKRKRQSRQQIQRCLQPSSDFGNATEQALGLLPAEQMLSTLDPSSVERSPWIGQKTRIALKQWSQAKAGSCVDMKGVWEEMSICCKTQSSASRFLLLLMMCEIHLLELHRSKACKDIDEKIESHLE
ncbi:hypothetical protein H920_12288 [Fukomys damarensis]|uniref:Uncharacterized protein n=1 Tax=Fukomys damarensis TaxID=885580 RepID=A0A091D2I2_FUKDA|nr:hypothetical protein H920_12288 [Fukomys damarensis]